MKLRITFNLLLLITLVSLDSCTQKNTGQKHAAPKNSKSETNDYAYQNVPESGEFIAEKPTGKFSQEERIKNVDGPVRLIDFISLTNEKQLEEIISKDALDDVVEKTTSAITSVFKKTKDKGQVILQFTLYKDKKPLLGLAVKGYLKETELNVVYDEVSLQTKETRTKKDSCVFQTIYSINEMSGVAFRSKHSPNNLRVPCVFSVPAPPNAEHFVSLHPHTTIFTILLGTTITFLGAPPFRYFCTSSLAIISDSICSLLRFSGNSILSRVFPLKETG